MVAAIITISVIVGLYILVILVVISQLLSINHKLKIKEHGINVILAQKFDLLVTLGKYLESHNAHLPEDVKVALSLDDYGNLKAMSTSERLSIKNLLMSTLNTMFFIAEENGLKDDKKYLTLKHSLKDVDENHRKKIALYNADATAYNYWVNSILFRPISRLFKIKGKDIMY